MDPARLTGISESLAPPIPWLRQLGLDDIERGRFNLAAITQLGLPADLSQSFLDQLAVALPKVSDPDLALNTLQMFVAASRSPLSLVAMIERDPEALADLLQLFAASQYLGDILVGDPEAFDLLRLTDGQPVARDSLVDEIHGAVEWMTDLRDVAACLRRYQRRETLRIAYGDIIRQQRIEVVTRQISYLADALCEAALRMARSELERQRGVPRDSAGHRARFVVIGLGRLGGAELNYASDIDVVLVYDGEGSTDGERPISNQEFFQRLSKKVVQLLSETTELGVCYRVDTRLRPQGEAGPLCISRAAMQAYYEARGRTWERQTWIKARPVAGDKELGVDLLRELESWIYRRYLNQADITGIKALKRRIEQRTQLGGADDLDVESGRGGLRDIEFVIQFLQLLNGGDDARLHTGNTLEAIVQLETAGCLTMQERSLLAANYEFLRRVELRLQIMFDLQTHRLPRTDRELRKLALRAGYVETPQLSALEAFRADFREKTQLNRQILDHLLHDAFPDDPATAPEVDLVLDPQPSETQITAILSSFGFRQPLDAYKHLSELAVERIPFLSTRRCRHFLAAITPALLKAIAATPDPDATLINLSRVSDSLGGKGVLWELFSFHAPSLNLYVRLCAACSYLSSILTGNPGMIDELLDSLILDKLPTYETLQRTLADLCRGAEDIQPMLHVFKNSQHLHVGVRDILGKEDIRAATATLSDVAEVCVNMIAHHQYQRLVRKFGEPQIEGDHAPRACEFTVLGMGKLGGREPNYHSEIDVVFLYEADGHTAHPAALKRREATTNQHFFSELGQRILKALSEHGPYGCLYEADARLRPTGRRGPMAVSIEDFRRYHIDGPAPLGERQALCQARPIFGSPAVRQQLVDVVQQIVTCRPWQPEDARQMFHRRIGMEQGASQRNLKRAAGGVLDIEFAVQLLQLKHVRENPAVFRPGTCEAIEALRQADCLPADDADFFHQSYRFLRSVEARLRLMNTTARHDLPVDDTELAKLAYLFDAVGPEDLRQKCRDYMAENRRRFWRIARGE